MAGDQCHSCHVCYWHQNATVKLQRARGKPAGVQVLVEAVHGKEGELQHGQGAVQAGDADLGAPRLQSDVRHLGIHRRDHPKADPCPGVHAQAPVGARYEQEFSCIIT